MVRVKRLDLRISTEGICAKERKRVTHDTHADAWDAEHTRSIRAVREQQRLHPVDLEVIPPEGDPTRYAADSPNASPR